MLSLVFSVLNNLTMYTIIIFNYVSQWSSLNLMIRPNFHWRTTANGYLYVLHVPVHGPLYLQNIHVHVYVYTSATICMYVYIFMPPKYFSVSEHV